MSNRTVSAYVSDEVAARVSYVAKREDRSTAQIAGQAIRFFTSLSREARASAVALETLATEDERAWVYNEIARILHIAEFEMTKRHMAESVREQVPTDATDEDLDRLAVEWTKSDAR